MCVAEGVVNISRGEIVLPATQAASCIDRPVLFTVDAGARRLFGPDALVVWGALVRNVEQVMQRHGQILFVLRVLL